MIFQAPLHNVSFQAQSVFTATATATVAFAALALTLLLPPRANLSISYSS